MTKLIVALIIAVPIALGLFWGGFSGQPVASKTTQKETCSFTAKPREFKNEPYYTGSLIDAHLHLPVSSSVVGFVGRRIGFEGMSSFGGKLTMDYLNCLAKSEGIVKTIGFFMPTKFSLGAEISTAKKMGKNYPGKFTPFLMPAPYSALRISLKDVRDTLDKNKGLFKGIGEVKVMDGTSLDNPYFSELFKIASEYDLVIMMHPFPDDKTLVKKILKQYPKVKFLLHGGHDSEWITEGMREYDNVYYSLDGDIAALYGWNRQHDDKEPSKEEWLSYIRENFDTLLNQELSYWKPRIEAYPDRFMWGTDRWYTWHFDSEVGGLLEEYGRSFIGRLPPSVQKRFAHENAEKLLKAQ